MHFGESITCTEKCNRSDGESSKRKWRNEKGWNSKIMHTFRKVSVVFSIIFEFFCMKLYNSLENPLCNTICNVLIRSFDYARKLVPIQIFAVFMQYFIIGNSNAYVINKLTRSGHNRRHRKHHGVIPKHHPSWVNWRWCGYCWRPIAEKL